MEATLKKSRGHVRHRIVGSVQDSGAHAWRATAWARSRCIAAGKRGVFLFGSELKALKSASGFSWARSTATRSHLQLRHNYVPAPYSIYRKASANCRREP
jgi:hypothetical protein